MVQQYADQLEPMDDIMGRLIAKYGEVNSTATYLAKPEGNLARRTHRAHEKEHGELSCAGRAEAALRRRCAGHVSRQTGLHARSEEWNWDNFLTDRPETHAVGMPPGLTLSNNGDGVDWCGSLFAGFGAQLVDAKGNITVRSDACGRC